MIKPSSFARVIRYIIIILVCFSWLFFLMSWGPTYEKDEMEYGVTYSAKHSRSLGLDWQETYLAILDDLGVKKMRLPVYWDIVQPEPDLFDWTELDWLIEEAEKRQVELILTVGQRVPRWPECHQPQWSEELSTEERQEALLEYIGATVTRYKQRTSVAYWQVENEPFLKYFGECPILDPAFLDQEIAFVKSLDTRPIIVTDSGELSLWFQAAKRADIFGSTLYLTTYSSVLDRAIRYPIGPVFFKIKKNLANLIAHPQDWIIIELQGEPWGKIAYQEMTPEERAYSMSPEKFDEINHFISKTGFRIFYWWGVEYWYWEKVTNDNPIFWDKAKALFKS